MDEIVSFSYIEVFTDQFLYNSPQFITDVLWHTQRLVNFVTIFLWQFIAPMWHRHDIVTPSVWFVHREAGVS